MQMKDTKTYLAWSAYVLALLVAVAVLPKLLTGFNGAESKLPFKIESYIFATKFTIGLILLYLTGLIAQPKKLLLKQSSRTPFTEIAIGLVVLCVYVYVRSLVNRVFYIPITSFEILAIIILPIGYTMRKFQLIGKHLSILKAYMPELILFWILLVGVAQVELPRDIMLSSDPDQHLFFAIQVAKLGGVALNQKNWGDLPFNYPAGTGVLIFVFSTLSFTNSANVLMAFPQIQLLLALFMIAEGFTQNKPRKNRIVSIFVMVIVCYYFLPYGFEHNHYHLEGYGRLISLWIVTLGVVWCLQNPVPSSELTAVNHAALLSAAVAVSVWLNPINGFLLSFLVGFTAIRSFKTFPITITITIVLTTAFIFLDPYYSSLVSGGVMSGGVELSQMRHLDLSLPTLLEETVSRFSSFSGNPGEFFKLPYFTANPLIVFSILFSAGLLLKNAEKESFALKLLVLVGLFYLVWAVLAALFQYLSLDTQLRLLTPYFDYSRMQFVYLLVFSLIALALQNINLKELHLIRSGAMLLLLGYAGSVYQDSNSTINKKARSGYCGSMGCTSKDDHHVLRESESLFKREYAKQDSPPRMLILNTILDFGIERWMMPRSGSRSAILYDTFPLAFYYYQGDRAYTLDNYRNNICENFDVEWLVENNIQFLFIPSDRADVCIHDYPTIESRLTTRFESGLSKIYQIY